MPLRAECAVAMLMQMTADDQTDVRPAELVEQSCPGRRHHARGTRDVVGWMFEEERLVQEQRSRPPGGTQLLVEPLILPMFLREARAEELRVDSEQAPASGIQSPAIEGKGAFPSREPTGIDDLAGVLAGWFVADVVVARQRHDTRAQLPQRCGCESDLGVTVGPVDSQVAIDDHRIAVRRVGKLARYAPVFPEEAMRR